MTDTKHPLATAIRAARKKLPRTNKPVAWPPEFLTALGDLLLAAAAQATEPQHPITAEDMAILVSATAATAAQFGIPDAGLPDLVEAIRGWRESLDLDDTTSVGSATRRAEQRRHLRRRQRQYH